MKLFVILLLTMFVSCGGNHPGVTPQQRHEKAIKRLNEATTDDQKLFALATAAKESLSVGKTEDALKYANDLLKFASKCEQNVNYGSAIQDGNIVLGRIALRQGHVDEAKRCLIEAGKAPGSPARNTFAPNMSLAKELLENGEREVVLQYLELCRRFWTDDSGKLDKWKKEIKAGKTPHFGANLKY